MGLSFPAKPLREAPGITAALVQPWNELVASLRDYFGKVPRVYFAELMVRTGQTNQSAFPIEVSVPEGLIAKGVTVCYVQNLDVPETQLHTQAVFCDWRPSGTGITVRYLTGLFSGAYAPANWRIVLRVEGD